MKHVRTPCERYSFFFPCHKRYIGGVEVQLHRFLSSALKGDEWLSLPGRFTPRKETRYPLNTGLCGTQSQAARFAPTGIRTPDRPARSIVATPTTQRRLLKTPSKTINFLILIPLEQKSISCALNG